MDIYDTGPHAAVADERTTLETFLDYYRAALAAKVRGVSEEDARRRLVGSLTTLAGLIKHMIRVEANWFQFRLLELPADEVPVMRWVADDHDGDWVVQDDESVDGLLALYEEECERSRATAARFELDHVVAHPKLGKVWLRWIIVHMIEETARHAGHADILREQIDGSIGD